MLASQATKQSDIHASEEMEEEKFDGGNRNDELKIKVRHDQLCEEIDLLYDCIQLTNVRMQIVIEDAECSDVEQRFGKDKVIKRSIDLIQTFGHLVSLIQIAQ